jgi:hypothetical protein
VTTPTTVPIDDRIGLAAATSRDSNIYVADTGNDTIRKIN